MIYESVLPLSSDAHRDVSVLMEDGYAFAEGISSVPILAAEFERAAADYPVVFAGDGDTLFPAALLGLRDGENLFLGDDGGFAAGYVPAFLRRYPFAFARSDASADLALCLDMGFRGVNRAGRGERLFDSEGRQTRYLTEMLKFAVDYQTQHEATRTMTRRLVDLSLLEAAEARVALPDGQTVSLTGFAKVSSERLASLDDATVIELFRTGMLGLCHAHLASLGQIAGLVRRMTGRQRGLPAQVSAPAGAGQAPKRKTGPEGA